MIKVFTTNESGKIELTKDELESALNEAYWNGYNARPSFIDPPYRWWLPQVYYNTDANPAPQKDVVTVTYGLEE